MHQSQNDEPSGAYFQAFLQLSKERMPKIRSQNPNITPSQARYLLLDVWRRMNMSERKWYVWRAINRKPEVQQREAALRGNKVMHVPTAPKVVGRLAPVVIEEGRTTSRAGAKTTTPSALVYRHTDYSPDTEYSALSSKTDLIKRPKSSARSSSASPRFDRVGFANDQYSRRHLSKSASARIPVSKQLQVRKESRQLESPSLLAPGRINFSELADFWANGRLLRETTSANHTKSLTACKKMTPQSTGISVPPHIVDDDNISPQTYPEKKEILAAAETASMSESEAVPMSLKAEWTDESVDVSPLFSSRTSRQTITKQENSKSANNKENRNRPVKTKFEKARPNTPLFSLTALDQMEESSTDEDINNQECHQSEPKLVGKYKTTQTGVKFMNSGSSSSVASQIQTQKATGFGKLRSLLSRNKTKKMKKYIQLTPEVSKMSLVQRQAPQEPQLQGSLKYHHAAAPNPTPSASVTEDLTEGSSLKNVTAEERPEQGFTAKYIKTVLNESNNSNAESTQGPDSLAESENIYTQEPAEDEPREYITIPCGQLVDEFTQLALSSDSDPDTCDGSSELLETSNDCIKDSFQDMLDETYNSADASIVAPASVAASISDRHCSATPSDGTDCSVIDLLETSLEQLQLSYLKDLASFDAMDLRDDISRILLSDDLDFSLDPVEEPRATGANSPEYQNQITCSDVRELLHCSESLSCSSVSDLSKLLSPDSTDRSCSFSRRFETSTAQNRFLQRLINLDHSYDSKPEDTFDSSIGSSANMSILSRAMKKAGLRFPQKTNESFRMAMENPLHDMAYLEDPSKRSCLIDLLNADDSQDPVSISTASIPSVDVPSEFSDDLGDEAGPPIFMKTSTPIKHQAPTGSLTLRSSALDRAIPTQFLFSVNNRRELDRSQQNIGNSSEEEEVVEIIYTTSSSEDDYSEEGKNLGDIAISGLWESSIGIPQVSDVSDLGNSEAQESDSSLQDLNVSNFTGGFCSSKFQMKKIDFQHQNKTWHPATDTSLPTSFLGNQSTTTHNHTMRRSLAKTNLLLRFDADADDINDTFDSNEDCGENFVKRMIKLGDMKSPFTCLRADARNDEIYKVGIKPRRRRYSNNPSSLAPSQFWASRHYIEETNKAVQNLLNTEFSSSDGSF